jgi:hypothetical protein
VAPAALSRGLIYQSSASTATAFAGVAQGERIVKVGHRRPPIFATPPPRLVSHPISYVARQPRADQQERHENARQNSSAAVSLRSRPPLSWPWRRRRGGGGGGGASSLLAVTKTASGCSRNTPAGSRPMAFATGAAHQARCQSPADGNGNRSNRRDELIRLPIFRIHLAASDELLADSLVPKRIGLLRSLRSIMLRSARQLAVLELTSAWPMPLCALQIARCFWCTAETRQEPTNSPEANRGIAAAS